VARAGAQGWLGPEPRGWLGPEPEGGSGRSPPRPPPQRFALGQRHLGVGDLDRGHAHGPGRFEVDAEVVEEHDMSGGHAGELTGEPVEAGVGLAAAGPGGLHHHVEGGQEVAVVHRGSGHDEVVGQQRSGEPGLAAASDGERHGRADITEDGGHHGSGVEGPACGQGLGLEAPGEGVEVDLTTLEGRPGVGVGIGGVEPADEAVGQAGGGLVVAERVEGAGGDDTAEVPEDRLDPGGRPVMRRPVMRWPVAHRPTTAVATRCQRVAVAPSEATSTRSSSPWNISTYRSGETERLSRPTP
jgi:hypothetical protein